MKFLNILHNTYSVYMKAFYDKCSNTFFEWKIISFIFLSLERDEIFPVKQPEAYLQ